MQPAVRELLGLNPGAESVWDWQALRREGLLCLAVDRLIRQGQAVPEPERQTYIQAVAFEMRCRHALTEISQAAAVEVLTFKGCALAFGLYPRPGLRSFGDIDLAVRPEDWSSMVATLQGLGYVQGPVECMFSRQALQVDLHRHPLHQLTQLVGPRSREWWSSALPLGVGRTLRLAHEHEFVLGLFHSAKHSFSRAAWILDLALLARQTNPDPLVAAVRRFRVERQLAYAAECLDRWFGAEFPAPLAALANRRWNFVEKRFVRLVLERRAPDFLGMLTPLSSAADPVSGLRYLAGALYPSGVPFFQRSLQLWDMLRTAWER